MKNSIFFIIVGTIVIVGSSSFAIIFMMSDETHSVKDVPENDKYCYSEIIVKTSKYMGGISDRAFVELIVRDEITKLGAIYDERNRDILVTDLGENNLRISLDGSWSLKQDRPNLLDSLTSQNFIEKIVENRGKLIVVACQ